jgi:hypothetical protein
MVKNLNFCTTPRPCFLSFFGGDRVESELTLELGTAMPDPITVGVLVVAALRLGAEAVVKTAVGEAVKDAYAALKNKISVWAASDVTALEKEPNSTVRQAVITEIVDNLSAADRDALRSLAQVLANKLEKQAPKIVGLDVGRLKGFRRSLVILP